MVDFKSIAFGNLKIMFNHKNSSYLCSINWYILVFFANFPNTTTGWNTLFSTGLIGRRIYFYENCV